MESYPVASISFLVLYCRRDGKDGMTPSRLSVKVLFGDIEDCGQRARPQNTWKALMEKSI